MWRWFRRFWLRYLFYWKQHWIFAASLTLTLLWLVWNVVVALLPSLLELLIALV